MPDSEESGVRVTKILLRAQDDPNALQELEQFRQTLVVMFSDIKGSTAYFEKHGDAAGLFMVRQCNNIIRLSVEEHGGLVIKTIGDGSMATFSEPKAAVKCAIAIQNKLARSGKQTPHADQIALRIGIHYGTGIVSTNDVFGDVVNVAARVESVAKPGQIVLSEESYQQVREQGFIFQELGRFSLKGKAGERVLFQVMWDEDPVSATIIGMPTLTGPAVTPIFKLQMVTKNGNVAAEYPVQPELEIVKGVDGRLAISADPNKGDRCARVFLEGEQLYVEEGSSATPGVFVRLSGTYVLEDRDVFLAGKQLFLYEERRSSTSTDSSTTTVVDLLPPSNVATLTRMDAAGKALARYPLSEMVLVGRTRGEHVFPEDNLMSRAHLRIASRGEDFVLEDLGSRNGTFLKLTRKSPLSSGSALLIGGQLFAIVS